MLAYVCTTVVVQADDAELRDRFLREYPIAAKRLQEFYDNIQMDEVHSHRVGTEIVRDEQCSYFSRHGQFGVRGLYRRDTDARFATVLTSQRSFRLRQERQNGKFSVMELQQRQAPKDSYDAFRLTFLLPFASYHVLDWRLVDWMSRPEFSVRAVVPVGKSEMPLVKVQWDCPLDEGGIQWTGWWLLSPEESWALRGYSLQIVGGHEIPQDSSRRCEIDYSGSHQGIPLIKAVTYWLDKDGKRSRVRYVKAVNVVLKPAPPEAFTLAAFGIREDVGQIKPVQQRCFVVWLFSLGSVGLAVAVFLACLARRRRSAKQP